MIKKKSEIKKKKVLCGKWHKNPLQCAEDKNCVYIIFSDLFSYEYILLCWDIHYKGGCYFFLHDVVLQYLVKKKKE